MVTFFADTWLMNDNYAMAPLRSPQLHVIHIAIGNTGYSTVFACLQNKSQDAYETLLQAVMDCCHEIDFSPDPKTSSKRSIIQAISNVFELEMRAQVFFLSPYLVSGENYRSLDLLIITKRVRIFVNSVDRLTHFHFHLLKMFKRECNYSRLDVVMRQLPC